MIFESIEQIKALIEKPINEEMLIRAKYIREKLLLHVCGIGLDSYLDKIQGVENENAISLRRALGKVITKSETQKIISVQNKIFSARGGGKFYDFNSQEQEQVFIENILSDVRKGMSISQFMQKEWKELVNIDPNGLLFIEVDNEGKAYLTYKSSEFIHDISFESPSDIDYIIFKPEIIDKKKYYRVIDDNNDYTIEVSNNVYSIVPEKSYINSFGFIPACFISDRNDKESNGFISHIDECLIPADDMLLDYTIYKIYKTKIGIPLHWQYEKQCAVCEGSGQVNLADSKVTCIHCSGRGYDNHNRDISDIIVLPLPDKGDIPLTPPAGYISGDLQTWVQYEKTIEQEAQKMYTSVWGNNVAVEQDRRNITASELSVREVSKEDKLNEVSDNEERVERFIVDCFGKFYYRTSYNGCIINNGRIFDIKTSDELLSQYNDGLIKNVPTSQLNELLIDYYHTIYKRNPKKLNESLVKLMTKPFFHWQPEKLVSAKVNIIDYFKNLYYDEFSFWYEENKEPYGITTISKVNESLEDWIEEKMLKIKEEENEITTNSGQEQTSEDRILPEGQDNRESDSSIRENDSDAD